MTDGAGSIPLAWIRPVFEGMIPATIASCSANGVPNVSYLSIVRRIDSERIAVTNQFFSKTAANLRANPHAVVRVVHPDDMSQYHLEARYLHSETSGELFDSVKLQLDAVAAQTGMSSMFRLRGVDVLRVDRCVLVGSGAADTPADEDRRPLSSLGVFVRRLAACTDLAEATRVGLESLDDLFGFSHSILLLTDDMTQRLFAVDAHGYPQGRVGAEVVVGEGLIGVAAQRKQAVRVTNMARSRTFAAAINEGDLHEEPLRGLDNAQSMIAAPMMLQEQIVGVLYLDSTVPGVFDAEAGEIVDIIAGHLAVTIALFDADAADAPDSAAQRAPVATSRPVAASSTAGRVVAFHEFDGSVFVDGDYIIRGIPGRILARLLTEHLASGRTQFSNKELRLDRSIELPAGNDNLDARLLVLRRRLAERDGFVTMERVGRGRIELTANAPFVFERHSAK